VLYIVVDDKVKFLFGEAVVLCQHLVDFVSNGLGFLRVKLVIDYFTSGLIVGYFTELFF